MAGIKVTFTLHTDGIKKLMRKLPVASSKAEHSVAVQAAKDTSQFVPAKTLSLDKRTHVEGRYIIYPGPYARMVDAGKKMVNAKTGKGPMRFVDKSGNEVIRFPKGSVLKATNEDLNIRTAVHKRAQAHFWDASKAYNQEKWLEVGKKAMMHYVRK